MELKNNGNNFKKIQHPLKLEFNLNQIKRECGKFL